MTAEELDMRLLFIICESTIEARVIEMLGRVGAPGYTKFTGASGSGKHGLREGSAVWPGLNSLILACVPESLVSDIHQGIDRLQADRNGRLAIKVFSVSAEEYS